MIAKLQEEILKKKAPVCVGLDPQIEFIPEEIRKKAREKDSDENFATAASFAFFNLRIIDAIADIVPAVKPQIAMYEKYGLPGLAAYEKTISYAKSKGLIVIADVKRGDIGSTSDAYAKAHLETFGADFATVNPYMGFDSVKPFVDVCNKDDRGIFVLVRTSNPSSEDFQEAVLSDGRHLYELVGQKVSEWGELSMDGEYSNVGAVVGATFPQQGEALRALMPHTFFLVPGYGAQGATAQDLKGFFGKDGTGAIVNSSRGIITAYTKEKYSKYAQAGDGFAAAARAAALDMIADLNTALGL